MRGASITQYVWYRKRHLQDELSAEATRRSDYFNGNYVSAWEWQHNGHGLKLNHCFWALHFFGTHMGSFRRTILFVAPSRLVCRSNCDEQAKVKYKTGAVLPEILRASQEAVLIMMTVKLTGGSG